MIIELYEEKKLPRIPVNKPQTIKSIHTALMILAFKFVSKLFHILKKLSSNFVQMPSIIKPNPIIQKARLKTIKHALAWFIQIMTVYFSIYSFLFCIGFIYLYS